MQKMKVVKFIKPGEKYTVQGIETVMGGFYVADNEGVSNISERERQLVENLLIDKNLQIKEGDHKYDWFKSYRTMKPHMRHDLVKWLADGTGLVNLEKSLARFYLHGLTIRLLVGENEEEQCSIEEYLLEQETNIIATYGDSEMLVPDIQVLLDDISALRAEWIFMNTKYNVREDFDQLIMAAGEEPDEWLYNELELFFGTKENLSIEELYHLAVMLGFINLTATERYRLDLKKKFHETAAILDVNEVSIYCYRKSVQLSIPMFDSGFRYIFDKKKIRIGNNIMDIAFDFSRLIETLERILDYLWNRLNNNPEWDSYNTVKKNAVTPVTPLMLLCNPDRDGWKTNGYFEYLELWFDLLFRDRKMIVVRTRDLVKALGYVPVQHKSMYYSLAERFIESLKCFGIKMAPDRTDPYWIQNRIYHRYDDYCVLWKNEYSWEEKKTNRNFLLFDFIIQTGKIIRKNGSATDEIALIVDYIEKHRLSENIRMELLANLYWITKFDGKRLLKWDNTEFRKKSLEKIVSEIDLFNKKLEWYEYLRKFKELLFKEDEYRNSGFDQFEYD